MIRAEFSRRFRALLSGSGTGVPAWTPLVAAGDDEGLFGPEDAAWIVHADLATLVGGIRALLVQALHPGSLAGVVQHSRYASDVLGRLHGTIRWLTISTFGSTAAVEEEAARVRALHEHVRGSYVTGDGIERRYRASDEALLSWVHLAFTDAFLACHAIYGARPVDADAYVAGWARAVQPLGLMEAPSSIDELRSVMASRREELRVDATTRRIVEFIRHAPFPRPARPLYWLLFQAAVDSLPRDYRELLGVRTLPRPIIRRVVQRLLGVMRWGLGDVSPMETAALQRRLSLRSG